MKARSPLSSLTGLLQLVRLPDIPTAKTNPSTKSLGCMMKNCSIPPPGGTSATVLDHNEFEKADLSGFIKLQTAPNGMSAQDGR